MNRRGCFLRLEEEDLQRQEDHGVPRREEKAPISQLWFSLAAGGGSLCAHAQFFCFLLNVWLRPFGPVAERKDVSDSGVSWVNTPDDASLNTGVHFCWFRMGPEKQERKEGRRPEPPHPSILNARDEPQDLAGIQTFKLLGCIPSLNLSDVINASKG